MAISALSKGVSLSQTTIQLDLDEPLNHAYNNFVGKDTSVACSISTLGSLASSILATYQQQWMMQRSNNGALPNIEFVVGGDEAPAAIYNSPTFAGGDTECNKEAAANQGEIACFLRKFNEAAAQQTYSVNGTTYMLSMDQQYYKFLLLDIGTTENDWKMASEQIFMQANGASLGGAGNLPALGYIFAVLNDKGPTAVLSNGGSTGKQCPQPSYWTDNSFCVADNAAIAAAQVKVEDILTLAQMPGHTDLVPSIVRVSSYDKSSPSHLLPDSDPASLTSFINWLNTTFAQGDPPTTLFELYQSQNVLLGSQYEYLTKPIDAEHLINMTDSPWAAHYPVGEVSQQGTIGTGITLQPLQRYLCNKGTAFLSDYLEVGQVRSIANCEWQSLLGYATPYDPNNADPCTLFDINGVALPYNTNCPNVADIVVYQYMRTNVQGSKTYNQYYYTLNPNDTTLTGVWPTNTKTPVFYVQPNWPLYPLHVPLGFQSGLRTDWSSGTATTLTFFDGPSMTFGFQNYGGSNVLALASGGVVTPLICEGGSPGVGVDCPSSGTINPLPCIARDTRDYPGLACLSQQDYGITQFPWGNPTNPTPAACCKFTMNVPVVGQDPVINFFPQSPYLAVYANDNKTVGPNP